MSKDIKYRVLNISALILVITSSIINFFISAIFQGISRSVFLFESYFNSGNSLFLPFLPDINLFRFLPIDWQIPVLSIGKLIDIIIIINITFAIQSGVYHSIKRIFTNDEFDDVGDSKLIERPMMTLISLSPNKPEEVVEFNNNIHRYFINYHIKKSKSELYTKMKISYDYRIKRRKNIFLFKPSYFHKKLYPIINPLFRYFLFFFFYPLAIIVSLPFEIIHSDNITFKSKSRIRLEESAIILKNYKIKNKTRF